jgi:hypothetical protein
MMEENSDEDDAAPSKSKRNRKTSTLSQSARRKPKAAVTTKGKNGTTKGQDGPKKLSMAEAFEPINRPLFGNLTLQEIRETKRFLDACGQEATDDIIGRLVGDQVDKIRGLLQRSLAEGGGTTTTTTPTNQT